MLNEEYRNDHDPIRILIAEDHKLLSETWRLLLNKDPRFNVVGEAYNGEEAVQRAVELNPDLVLMDLNMGPVTGYEATESILKMNEDAKVLAVSMNLNLSSLKRILKIGAIGYVSKNASLDELTTAIVEGGRGRKFLCSETKELLANDLVNDSSPGPEVLSQRELDIIQLIKKGHSSREIGDLLGIKFKTVEAHRYNILKKMKLKNSAALVNFSNEHGF